MQIEMADNTFLILLTIFAAINLFAFFVMLFDKNKAKNSGAERISEGMLFFMAAAFGSVGVYAGMLVFRHKTRKWYFIVGIPLIMLQNFSFLYLCYLLLGNQ